MTNTSGTIPSDMVSVYDNAVGQWWIYYVSTDGQIKIIKGPKDGQVEDSEQNPPYENSELKITATNIPPAKTGNPQLGVCEYIDNSSNPQTRVYYLDQKDRLCELGWNAEKGWFKGSLNSQEFKASPNSVITTAVTKEQLKIYYRGDNDDYGNPRLWVAWVTKGEKTWSRRSIMQF